MKRREFIASTGLLAAGLAINSCRSESKRADRRNGMVRRGSGDWEWVRNQFNLSSDKIHMGAMLIASHPQPVREAIEAFRRRLDEEPVSYLNEENERRQRAARKAAADYFGGSPENVALTDSTTMGIALVYHGLPLRPGHEILTTEHDYYATHETLRQVSHRTGATLRRISLFDEAATASVDQIVTRISSAITPATRALALTWVHSSTGMKLPVAQISEAVADVNNSREPQDRVLVCVDGVHGFGIEDVTAEDLGCDFFMAGCHKWLFGPRGTGIVWGRTDAWENLQPIIPSFMDQSSWTAWANGMEPPKETTASRMSPGGFKPFEHQWAMVEAFAFHHDIGKSQIAERTHELNRQLKQGLASMPNVTLHTPRSDDLSAGIVCFDIDGMEPKEVVSRLADRNIIATTTPYLVSYPRLTPCIYNTPEEVEQVLREIRELI